MVGLLLMVMATRWGAVVLAVCVRSGGRYAGKSREDGGGQWWNGGLGEGRRVGVKGGAEAGARRVEGGGGRIGLVRAGAGAGGRALG